jgi:hypothetical protein
MGGRTDLMANKAAAADAFALRTASACSVVILAGLIPGLPSGPMDWQYTCNKDHVAVY